MSEGAAAVQRTMKNVLANARNMGAPSDADFGANAGADSDDENESLASEFEEEENIVRSNVGQKRTHGQSGGNQSRYEMPSKRQNRGGY